MLKQGTSLPDEPFIFVSYSSKDSDFVHPEIRRLEGQGYKVWYDKGELQPGRLWDIQISWAIKECACFIVFITQDAVDSAHVCDEIDQALQASKPFICIYLEKVEVLPSRFREQLRSIQALERYALRRFEYEEPLGRALLEYIQPVRPEQPEEAEPEKAPALLLPDTRLTTLPKLLFFMLLLLALSFLFLATITMIIPFLAAADPNDPKSIVLSDKSVGFMVGFFLIGIALIFGGGALAVKRIYLRREKWLNPTLTGR